MFKNSQGETHNEHDQVPFRKGRRLCRGVSTTASIGILALGLCLRGRIFRLCFRLRGGASFTRPFSRLFSSRLARCGLILALFSWFFLGSADRYRRGQHRDAQIRLSAGRNDLRHFNLSFNIFLRQGGRYRHALSFPLRLRRWFVSD